MDDFRVKDVSTLLNAFFDQETARKGGRYAQFFSSWRAIVGERLAAHSRVVDIEKQTLIVEAEHPGWIQLLQLRQAEILEGVRGRFPEFALRGILFRVASVGKGDGREAPPSPGPGPFGPRGRELNSAEDGESALEEREIRPLPAVSTDQITDPALREGLEALKRAMEDPHGGVDAPAS